MGTWGYGPFDNDDAANMVAALTRDVTKAVERKSHASAEHYYLKARAVAQIMLMTNGTDILGGPCLETALRALVRMRSDTDWINGWREPRKLARALNTEITTVHGRLRIGKSWRSRPKRERDEIDALVAKVIRVKVASKSTPPDVGLVMVAEKKRRRVKKPRNRR